MGGDHPDSSSLPGAADFDAGSGCPLSERAFVPKQGKWSGHWIWLNSRAYPDRQRCRPTVFCGNEFPHTVAMFRKTFDVPFVPCRTTIWISGDTKYRCWVNGVHAASGPAEVGGDYGNCESPDWWFYEGVELANAVRRGRNVIAAEVVLGPQVQADYSMGRGGFLLEMLVEAENGERLVLGTDSGWRAAVCEAELQAGLYDARRETAGWTNLDCDDSGWPPADIVGPAESSVWNLLPREIPLLAQTRVPPISILVPGEKAEAGSGAARPGGSLFPLRLKPGGPMLFWLKFSRELTGRIFLDVDGPRGTRLDIDFQELRGVSGNRESYILPGRKWSYQSRGLQGFEYLQVAVAFPGGQRCDTPLTIRALDAVFTSFPVACRGQFECSDAFLNRLWSAGRWTNRLCMQSFHLDSPIHQEGLGCTGDYMIEALISYCCFGEARLARKDILRTAYLLRQKKGRMFHTSYSLLWVWMLRDYWMFSGDETTVGEVLSTMLDLLDLFDSYVGDSGLVTGAPNYMFMDWVKAGGYTLHHPPASMGHGYMSAFYFRALQFGAELSRLCGARTRAKTCDRRARALKLAFNQRLWRPARGLYRDGIPGATKTPPNQWLPADAKEDSFTIHTNAAAVAVGIATPARGRDIMRRAMADKTLPAAQPYFTHFIFEALARSDLFEEHAFGMMDRWKPILEEHPSSLKEMWDGGDYSHAWSGTPAYQLSARALGISARDPGFCSLTLRPRLGPLRTAKGVVPTPRGPIEVSWKRVGGFLKGRLRGPAGCRVFLEAGRADCRRISVRQAGRPVRGLKKTAGGQCWILNNGEFAIDIPA